MAMRRKFHVGDKVKVAGMSPVTFARGVNSRVQLGSKTWPFCADFGGLIVVRATESMGLRV